MKLCIAVQRTFYNIIKCLLRILFIQNVGKQLVINFPVLKLKTVTCCRSIKKINFVKICLVSQTILKHKNI